MGGGGDVWTAKRDVWAAVTFGPRRTRRRRRTRSAKNAEGCVRGRGEVGGRPRMAHGCTDRARLIRGVRRGPGPGRPPDDQSSG